MSIKFHFQHKATFKNRKSLKRVLSQIFKDAKVKYISLDYIFCDDPYLLSVNRSFLNHDNFTDIITFNLASEGLSPVVGEIYISVDRVIENAQIFNVSQTKEFARVIFHGALHLCGYNDKSTSQKKLMRSMEDRYLIMFHGEHK